MRKVLSFLLALIMVLSMVPLSMLSALEVSAGTVGTTPVTLTVTPSGVHAEKGDNGYTLTAALTLTTTQTFTMGSIQFEMTPAEGITLQYSNEGAVVAVEKNAKVILDDEGAQFPTDTEVFAWKYTSTTEVDPETQKETTTSNAVELTAGTEYSLGTVTMTSTNPFSFSNADLKPVVVGVYDTGLENGVAYPMTIVLDSDYDKCSHNDTEVTWQPIADADALAAIADNGYYYLAEDVTATGSLALAGKNVTLCLNGKTLTGMEGAPLFALTAGAELTLCDCSVKRGKIVPGGSVGGSVVLITTDFANDDKAAALTLHDVVIDGTGVSNDNNGGAICVNKSGDLKENLAATVALYNCEVNNVKSSGGAIRVTSATLTIKNSTFDGNVATNSKGGAIYADALSTLDITGSTFTNNEAKYGGALFNEKTTTTITDTTFTENTCTSASGSALFISSSSEVTLKNATITGNTHTVDAGGAVWVQAKTSKLIVSGGTRITGNYYGEDGAAGNGVYFYAKEGQTGDKDILFVDELTRHAKISVGTWDDRSEAIDTLIAVDENGSQTAWENAWVEYTYTGKYISRNSDGAFTFGSAHAHKGDAQDTQWIAVEDSAGLAAAINGGHYVLTEDITLSSYVHFNVPDKDIVLCLNGYDLTATGARLFGIRNGVHLTICDCTGAGIMKPGNQQGGAVAIWGTASGVTQTRPNVFTLEGGIIDGTGVTNQQVGSAIMAGSMSSDTLGHVVNINGGEIRNCRQEYTDTTVTNNTNSGTISLAKYAKLYMTDGRLFNNYNEMGTIYLTAAYTTAEITGGEIVGNHTEDKGAAIYNKGGAVTISGDVKILGNESATCGGAVNVDSGTLTIGGNAVFDGNTAGTTGGAIHSAGATTITGNVQFTDNTCGSHGGAIYCTGNLAITGATFDGNKSTSTSGEGGAIYSKTGTLAITDCVFINNKGAYGGALRRQNSTAATVSGTTFSGNTSPKPQGSAIYLSSSANITLDSCTITGNTATANATSVGTAVYVNAKTSILTVSGSTKIYGNYDTNNARGDLYYFHKDSDTGANNLLHVNELTDGAKILINTSDDRTADATTLIKLNGTQEKWDASWIQYTQSGKYIGRDDNDAFVYVDEPGVHTHEGDDTTWTPMAEQADLVTNASGNYYLTQDVSVTTINLITPGTDIVLCLNGHNITTTSTRIFTMKNGSHLTICDCSAHDGADGSYVSGRMIPGVAQGGAVAMNKTDSGVSQTRSNVFTLEDGTIYADGLNSENYGVVMAGSMDNADIHHIVNMNGGVIRGFTTTNNGGAVFCGGNAEFNMTGGKISGNTALRGGAIYAGSAGVVCNIKGGEITGNTADNGGAIYVGNATANVLITAGEITGNTADNGGAVRVYRGVATIQGTEESPVLISGNTSNVLGGAIAVGAEAAGFAMSNVTLTGNSTAGNGGALEINIPFTLTDDQNVTIEGNAAAAGDGVYTNAALTLVNNSVTDEIAGSETGSVILANTSLTYDSTEPAVVTNIAEGTPVSQAHKVGNKRYVVLAGKTGYEIHRVQLSISGKVLRPTNDGLGLRVRYSAAASLGDKVTSFGIDLVVKDADENVKGTLNYELTKEDKVMENGQDLIFIVKGILKETIEEGEADNAIRATYYIEGTPFIVVDGQKVTGATSTANFKDLFVYANGTDGWENPAAKHDAIAQMYNRYSDVMKAWGVDKIAAHAATLNTVQ